MGLEHWEGHGLEHWRNQLEHGGPGYSTGGTGRALEGPKFLKASNGCEFKRNQARHWETS